jgi:hypothetical protein
VSQQMRRDPASGIFAPARRPVEVNGKFGLHVDCCLDFRSFVKRFGSLWQGRAVDEKRNNSVVSCSVKKVANLVVRFFYFALWPAARDGDTLIHIAPP